ncbi:hypothetical protein V7S43_001496 [Phytophthora oleae]|uniref:BZIP domain-containing protein n=1 Tax=Phytophthora oleae TaxID=2107226 RepID=A0ABD3G9J1_9STRA
MAFVFPDDAFLAALSFVEEFTLDDTADEHASSNTQLVQGIAVPPQCSEPVIVDSDTLKQRRQRQANERKKLLRKSGIYGDPNRARSERRQEIARLREQLEQLQLDVQVLRSRETERPWDAACSQNVVSLPSKVPVVWQEMAMRQRRRREESERENIHLKLVVKRQHLAAQTLGALVRRRAFQVSKECSDLITQPSLTHHVVNILDIEGDMEDFRILFQRMETACRGMEELFCANGLASSELPLDEVYLRESVGGGYLECFSHKVLPFELRATAEVVWEHFKGIEKHYRNGSLYTKAAKVRVL